mgnify:CR=1 FL=1
MTREEFIEKKEKCFDEIIGRLLKDLAENGFALRVSDGILIQATVSGDGYFAPLTREVGRIGKTNTVMMLRRSAYDKGYDEGYKEGHEEGYEVGYEEAKGGN